MVLRRLDRIWFPRGRLAVRSRCRRSIGRHGALARPAKLAPNTVESLPQVSDGGKTYLFRIRKGIFFTPDAAFKGQQRELTAADYAYSFKRFLDPINRSPYAFLFEGKIVGLSKLARIVEVIAHRPQVQERMTEQLADLIEGELHPKGVAVVLEAAHSCMTIRGIHKPGSLCTTSALRGVCKENLSTRSELMTLIYGGKRGCG